MRRRGRAGGRHRGNQGVGDRGRLRGGPRQRIERKRERESGGKQRERGMHKAKTNPRGNTGQIDRKKKGQRVRASSAKRGRNGEKQRQQQTTSEEEGGATGR
eukprot:1853417-Rhodomonas_salina.3